MDIASIDAIVRYEIWFLAGGLALIVGFRLLTGGINTKGLLNDKVSGAYSPARLQLLLFTLGGAVYYASLCYHAKAFAPVPNQLAAALGGSNAFYVLRKFFAMRPGNGN
jgi:hypothetical protein